MMSLLSCLPADHQGDRALQMWRQSPELAQHCAHCRPAWQAEHLQDRQQTASCMQAIYLGRKALDHRLQNNLSMEIVSLDFTPALRRHDAVTSFKLWWARRLAKREKLLPHPWA